MEQVNSWLTDAKNALSKGADIVDTLQGKRDEAQAARGDDSASFFSKKNLVVIAGIIVGGLVVALVVKKFLR